MSQFWTTEPTKFIWVSPSGNNANSGTPVSPMQTIQAAIAKATPGTAIMVTAGTYDENVKITVNGTEEAPIWLVSADGPGAAKIVPVSQNLSTVYGFGTQNFIMKDFMVQGPTAANGIHFGQAGADFTKIVKNVMIEGNTVIGAGADGIKISQADNIHVLNNTTTGAGDQGIDFVAVNNSVIRNNDVSDIRGATALFVKGGSENVMIAENRVHNVSVDAIAVGGWSSQSVVWPQSLGLYEARNVQVVNNQVWDQGKRALNILGADTTVVEGNLFKGNPLYNSVVNIGPNQQGLVSRNVEFTGNTFDRTAWLRIETGNNNAITSTNNGTDGVWRGGVVLPAAATVVLPADPLKIADLTFWKESGAHLKSFAGTAGADHISGTDGNDQIDGGLGIDTMVGGKGDDKYVVSSRYDKIVEQAGEGVEIAFLWDTQYVLSDNVENLTVKTGSGASVAGNKQDNVIRGGSGNDVLNGAGGNDLLYGGAGRDTFVIERGNGSDVVADFMPGAGGDYVDLRGFGFADLDQLRTSFLQVGDHAVLRLGGGETLTLRNVDIGQLTAENFRVSGAPLPSPATHMTHAVDALLVADIVNLPLSETSTRTFMGTSASDTIRGSEGHDWIDGGPGHDMMLGGKGDDIYVVGSGFDQVVESPGEGRDSVNLYYTSFTLPANVENLIVKTSAGALAKGNALANIVQGGAGNDIINGGEGNDLLIGGSGNDVFIHQKGDGIDVILDFKSGAGTGDMVALHDHGFASFDAIRSAMTQTGNNVELDLSGGDFIIFMGQEVMNFAPDDFMIKNVPAEYLL